MKSTHKQEQIAYETRALADLTREVFYLALKNINTQDVRQRKAIELLDDAAQMLHAASVNLQPMEIEEDPEYE